MMYFLRYYLKNLFKICFDKKNKPMAPTIFETGLPTPHTGHSKHGLFFTRWIVNPMLNLLKKTMT
jgi:hypothetical protein